MLNTMQEAFINAALAAEDNKTRRRVVRVAERIKVREPKDNIKLSYKTAQKLKAQGVLV